MWKRWMAVILGMALCVALAACGSKKQSDGEKVVAAIEKMRMVQSYHSIMKTEVAIQLPEIGTMDVSMDMDISCFADPLKAQVDMKICALGEDADMSMFMQEKNGKYEVCMLEDGQWTRTEMSAEEVSQMDTKASLQLYVDSSKSFSFVRTEIINGYSAERYDGVIEGEAMKKALSSLTENSGLPLDKIGLDKEQLDKLGKLPISIWIDQESGYPVYYSMDMKEIVRQLMEQLLGILGNNAVEINVETMKITMEFSDFNAVTDFEIPVGAGSV